MVTKPTNSNDVFTIAVNNQGRDKDWDFQILTDQFLNYNLNVSQLADAINQGFAVVFAQMKQNEQGCIKRCSQAFLSSDIVGIDIDNSITINGKKEKVPDSQYYSLDNALAEPFIQSNALLIYTTASHTNECNRFRIVFRLPKIITDPKEYTFIVSALIRKYGGDKACTDPCRVFFGSSNSNPVIIGKTMVPQALSELLATESFVADSTAPQVSKRSEKATYSNTPKLSIEQVRDMLQTIADNSGGLEYNEWLELIGALFDKYTLDEIKPILVETLGEQKSGEYEQKYAKGLTRIPFDHFVRTAIKYGYRKPITLDTDFIVLTESGKPKIHQKRLLDFLHDSGYRKYYLPESNNYQFIKIFDNVASVTTPSRIKSFIQNDLEQTLDNDTTCEELLNQLVCGKFATVEKLEYLRESEFTFQRDTHNASFIFLQNGFIRAHKEYGRVSANFHNYSELCGIIWQRWQKPHTWFTFDKKAISTEHTIHPDRPQHTHKQGAGQFEQFVDHICYCDPDRIKALHSAIGYLLHAYKAPSISKAIVFCDEKISDYPSGGTGKSLLAQAMAQVRTMASEDGKRFDSSNRFCFQNVNTDTQIVVLDDITKNFDFESLFHLITGDFEYEPKGQAKVKIPYSVSPKILLTTNFTVLGHGSSFKRRIAEYEIASWYTESYTPIHDFGGEFFTQWSEQQWVLFYAFMSRCIQTYLKNGLIVPEPKNLNYRKLLQKTNADFIEYMNDKYFKDGQLNEYVVNQIVTKRQLYLEFCDQYTDWGVARNNGTFSQQLFGRWLSAFAMFNDLDLKDFTQKQNGKTIRVMQFIKKQ